MKIISLDAVRETRKILQGDPDYERKILNMDKVALLDEMMRFQQERTSQGHLTLTLMIRGRILFRMLESCAETEELSGLAGAYHRHLLFELEAHLKNCKEDQLGCQHSKATQAR